MAFVRRPGSSPGAEGAILEATGGLLTEVQDAGWGLSDHGFRQEIPYEGLSIFEGWADPSEGYLRGTWRRLSSWELGRVSQGLSPFRCMTVGELIARLQEEDPNRVVILSSDPEGNVHRSIRGCWRGVYVSELGAGGEVYLEGVVSAGAGDNPAFILV